MKKIKCKGVTFLVGPDGINNTVRNLFREFDNDEGLANEFVDLNITKFNTLMYKSPHIDWVNKWLHLFDLPEIAENNRYGDFSTTRGEVILNLLSNLVCNTEPSITVWYPECRLWPMYQSHLANLFLDVFDTFGTKSIVVTNSEYMIKRAQIVVRRFYNRGMGDEVPYVVYAVDKELHEMTFHSSGRFTEIFPIRGLFDESSCLSFQLI